MEKSSLLAVFSGLVLLALPATRCAPQDVIMVCTPEQIHLSYGDSASEVVVMWTTHGECTTVVKFSKVMWNLDQSAPGESRLFGGESNKAGQHNIHFTKITNLEPDTTYFYKPMSSGIMSAVYFFKTPPVSTSGDVSFMVISDLTFSSPSTPPLINELLTGKYAALLHAGNLAGNLSGSGGRIADRYFRQLQPGLSYVPYMTSPGDWERERDNMFSQYTHRLFFPKTSWPAELDDMWYSVDIGPVHLISFSTEVFFAAGGKHVTFQHDWLIKDLKVANGNREKVPWVVAFGHEPLYCSNVNTRLDCALKTSPMKKGLEDIFYYYGVDILLMSSRGSYERSYPMYKGVQVSDNYTNPRGPIYINLGPASPFQQRYNFTDPPPDWVANRLPNETRATYGRLHIINASIAEFEDVAFVDGEVLDAFSIHQSKHGEFSVKQLPKNISAEIDKEIIESGGKPEDRIINIHEIGTEESTGAKLAHLLDAENRNKVIIAGSVVSFLVIVFIILLVVRRMRRRRRITRRWEQMDINYGKKFYSKAPDRDEDNDFEIDMTDDTESNRKLLNADD